MSHLCETLWCRVGRDCLAPATILNDLLPKYAILNERHF